MKPLLALASALFLLACQSLKSPPSQSAAASADAASGITIRAFDLDHNADAAEYLPGMRLAWSVQGLVPGATYSLVLTETGAGTAATARASFIADADGVIRTERDAPRSGSYADVDVDGLLWSRTPLAEGSQSQATGNSLLLSVEKDGLVISSKTLAAPYLSTKVTVETLPLATYGFAAGLFEPKGVLDPSAPVVIAFSGSEGGIGTGDLYANSLAAEGIPSIGLAYFGFPGLPAELERIPLEYFQRVFQFIATRSELSGRRIVVLGMSRGGELALLLASTFPEVGGVIALSPSPYSWGDPHSDGTHRASWTYGGLEVPYFKLEGEPDKVTLNGGITAIAQKSQFQAAIGQFPPSQRPSFFLNQIQGPILAIGGREDLIWDSCSMINDAKTIATAHSQFYDDQFICYSGAGHDMSMIPGFVPTGPRYIHHTLLQMTLALGGTAADTAHAQRATWNKILDYLRK